MTDETRTNRNELLFGAEGQAKIAAASVAIVGLGGLGSPVAQQLAYLGTLDYVLIDRNVVSTTSLNRLVGAGPDDVGRPKIDVAERLIRLTQPDARIRAIDAWIDDEDAKAAVRSSDVVFGCLDEDPPRLALVELTSPGHLPYFDLATDVSLDGTQYGGRVLVSLGGERCLFCMGMLDQRALRRATQTPDQRAEDDRIYGISRDALGAAGPSVVSLNGVVAALAVTEFMVWITGMRDPRRYLVYHAESGIVTRSQDPPAPHCPKCGR